MKAKRIYVGKSMSYQQALVAYKAKVGVEIVENNFAYCGFTGMGEAELSGVAA